MTMFDGAEWDAMVEAGARAMVEDRYGPNAWDLMHANLRASWCGYAAVCLSAALRVTLLEPCATCGGTVAPEVIPVRETRTVTPRFRRGDRLTKAPEVSE